MTFAERERAILENLRSKLVAEGYEVILEPTWMDLPDFLRNLRPDAVAHRADEHLAIEVVARSPRTEARLKELGRILEDQRGWKLHTVWTSPQNVPSSLQTAPLGSVTSALNEINDLIQSAHLRPAFLIGWAALESLGRRFLPTDLAKPQTPRRLIEYLAANGFIDRVEAKHLRRLAEIRNRLIHGELHVELSESELIEIRDILWKLHDRACDRDAD